MYHSLLNYIPLNHHVIPQEDRTIKADKQIVINHFSASLSYIYICIYTYTCLWVKSLAPIYGSLSHGIHGCLFPSYDSHLLDEAMFLCRGVVAALVPFIPSTAGKAASALGIFMGFGFGFRCWDDGLKS